MKPAVYLETSIIGYLTSRQSRDTIISAHQQITREWWENRRVDFDMYVSQLVIREVGEGDPVAANKRLEIIHDIPILELSAPVIMLAEKLIESHAVPREASEDALHIAVAIVHGIDYLLTWNCRHIANAERQNLIEVVSRDLDYEIPVICTPEELLGE